MARCRTDSLFETEEGEESGCSHIIRVAFESGADTEFDYLVPDEIWPVEAGQRVEAPFGKADKVEKGFCVEADVPFEKSFIAHGRGRKLKKVADVIDKKPLVDAELMALARWISGYYVCPLGQVLAAIVPGAVKKGAGVKTQKYVYEDQIELAWEQVTYPEELERYDTLYDGTEIFFRPVSST